VNGLIVFLRWTARISATLAVLLFAILFFQDGLPLYLFSDASNAASVFHMWALLVMLIGLGLGWRWEGLAAALVLGAYITDTSVLAFANGYEYGVDFGLTMALSTLALPFVIIPLSGIFFLICWTWDKTRAQK